MAFPRQGSIDAGPGGGICGGPAADFHPWDLAAVEACHPAGSGFCQQAASDFASRYVFGVGVTAALLQAAPVLIGAFAGAPVLARKLEAGTFRYAWTQGFGRTRWTIAMLARSGRGRRRSVQRTGLLVGRAALGHSDRQQPAPAHDLRPARGRARRLELAAFAIGAWPACSSAGSSPR